MDLPAFSNLKPSMLVEEFDRKAAAIDQALSDFEKASDALKIASTIAGEWGGVRIDTGRVSVRELNAALLTSAWRHLYKIAHIGKLATATEKRAFEQSMADPPPFTIDNIRASFGKYIADPRGSILKGLAEAFCAADPAYKSHDKVKIGVKGLPKRIILSNVSGYGSWGRDRLENMLDALATYQGKPLITYEEMNALMKDESALLDTRGIRLRRFGNGNAHLFFEPDALLDINRALADYYGEVLPDCYEARPEKRAPGTSVSKDLQYYPTPPAVAERLVSEISINENDRVLEPSCGCGRILDVLASKGVRRYGIEVDPARAEEARQKGHPVHTGNFLETAPTQEFDHVVMNPPFYGKHYARHIEHALRFLKPGGWLASILPATARYDHNLITAAWANERGACMAHYSWTDLPLGSFSESGTNINTVILTMRKNG